MAVIGERWDSRVTSVDVLGDATTIEVRLFVYDVLEHADNDVEVKELVQATLPAFWRGLGFDSFKIEPQGGEVWMATATYGHAQDTEVTFETLGATAKVTQSLFTNAYNDDVADPPDFQGAINVNGDSVEGVEVVVPHLPFKETWLLPRSIVLLPAFINTLFGLTGRTNDAVFRQFQPGEVLFLGASGKYRVPLAPDYDQDVKVPITFSFVAAPNVLDLTIGTITPIEKLGHEFLWTLYEDSEDENTLVKVPKAVYVERVYRSGDFSLLGIGT